MKDAGQAPYHGRAARPFVTEAAEAPRRPGRPGRSDQGQRRRQTPGPPPPRRLIFAEVRDLKGVAPAR